MRRIEFEQDLMEYISQRRSARRYSFWKQLFEANKSSGAVSHTNVRDIAPVRVEQPVDVPVSDDVVVESEYEADNKGLFSRVVDWVVAGSPEKHDVVVEPPSSVLVEDELKNDLKEVAQISIRVFRQLPVHKVRELKESSDFARFKFILKKHNLSRE
ncbi:hypothetical protein HY484_00895 [Candidatus Woesearchaeota archaeon]|nr:hypothetical protein [Candidatus Woesearchaeota archaeon]